MRPKNGYPCFAALAVLLFCSFGLGAQDIDLAAATALEEFRFGVQAFHNGAYNEAILAFEQAQALTPQDARIQEWLGHAYLRSGYVRTALTFWDRLAEQEAASSEILYLSDTIRWRTAAAAEVEPPVRYVVADTHQGRRGDLKVFSRPMSVSPSSDGGYYLTSFAGNEVIEFGANGDVRQRILGGIEGLDHPADVVRVDGTYLFITEFLGNRIVRTGVDGGRLVRFGEKGTGPGQLIGPQYIADDAAGYVYVTETGNRRVSKFDYEGQFILSFGEFISPTGIVCHGGMVYVADGRAGVIAEFDSSGNFVRLLGEGDLEQPEGLSVYEDGTLMVADTRRIVLLDVETETVRLLSDMEGRGVRVTKAIRDVNGNIVVADFTQNMVAFLTRITSLYVGLLPQVQRVVSADFPSVMLEARVQDREGRPIVGLDERNFIITENSIPVGSIELAEPAGSQQYGVSVLVDRSTEMRSHEDAVLSVVRSLSGGFLGSATIGVFTSEAEPTKVASSSESLSAMATAAVDAGEFSDEWRFDLGLRLAASDLITFPGRRAVVFVTAGTPGDRAFDDYDLDVLRAYLEHNDIAFYCVYVRQDPVNPQELEFLCRETGGRSAYVFQPTGIAPLVDAIRRQARGRYLITYSSGSPTDFGNAYIRVGLEILFHKRSGRCELGYFAPLEF